MKKQGVAVNVDSDVFWYIHESRGKSVNGFEEAILTYLDGYREKGISDLFFCCFCQCSVFPSRTMTGFADKTDQKLENGIPVDYSSNNRVRHLSEIYGYMKRDPFSLLLEESERRCMNAWLSVRMNDTHDNLAETSWLRSDMFYEALHEGLFVGDDVAGPYYGRCLNYAFKKVRARFYAYLCELLDRYDVYGLELDFMRECVCFRYTEHAGCADIMTEFIRSVRAYADKKGAERGKRIRLAVRVLPDPEDCLRIGFDVKRWAEEGLVDLLIPSARWASTDCDIPMERWHALTAKSGVSVWPALEILLQYPFFQSIETVRGFAAEYFSAGAEKIYLYNFFRTCADSSEEARQKAPDFSFFTDPRRDAFCRRAWEACATKENALSGVRRHVLTYREGVLTPRGGTPHVPFPTLAEGEKSFTVRVSPFAHGRATLLLGVESDQAPAVEMDGVLLPTIGESCDAYPCVPCHDMGRVQNPVTGYERTTFFAYALPASEKTSHRFTVKGKGVTLTYLEVKIEE